MDGFKCLNVTDLKINGQKKETTVCCTNASSWPGAKDPRWHCEVFAVCLIRRGITEDDIPAGPVSISGWAKHSRTKIQGPKFLWLMMALLISREIPFCYSIQQRKQSWDGAVSRKQERSDGPTGIDVATPSWQTWSEGDPVVTNQTGPPSQHWVICSPLNPSLSDVLQPCPHIQSCFTKLQSD